MVLKWKGESGDRMGELVDQRVGPQALSRDVNLEEEPITYRGLKSSVFVSPSAC